MLRYGSRLIVPTAMGKKMKKHKQMKRLLLILSIFGILISCNNDDGPGLNGSNFLIFGHFYGMCAGEGCIEIFKLTEKELYEDIRDEYAAQNMEFVELGNDKFEQVKDLMDFFPNQLLNHKETVFGCPDCSDGGGLFIQYSYYGKVKTWRIDQFKDNVPKYLHGFMDKVNEKIKLINEFDNL